jgi:hypothetical protein
MILNEFLQNKNKLNIPHIILEEEPSERMIDDNIRSVFSKLGDNYFLFIIQRPFMDIHAGGEFDSIINANDMSLIGRGEFKVVKTFVRSSPKLNYIPSGYNGIILLSVPTHLIKLFNAKPQRIALVNFNQIFE